LKYAKTINRTKGTIETFSEDASVIADNSGLAVSTMTAVIVSGTSLSIESQSYASETLLYQLNFSKAGSTILKVTTTFSGSSEAIVTIYLFRTIDPEQKNNNDYWP
jgi:hypothetical protein